MAINGSGIYSKTSSSSPSYKDVAIEPTLVYPNMTYHNGLIVHSKFQTVSKSDTVGSMILFHLSINEYKYF